MISIILIVILALAFVVGALLGVFKGYVRTSIWGLAALLTLAVARIVGLCVKKGGMGFSIGVLVATVASLVVFILCLGILKKVMNKRILSRKTLSGYENFDKLEENNAYILDAVDRGDKKAYKKLRKERKKIKEKTGAWGVLNRIFGGIAGALNWFVGAFIVVAFFTLFADISRIHALSEVFGDFISTGIWPGFLAKISLDVIIISVLYFTIRIGYNSGICSALTIFVILGLMAAFGYASYSLASSEAMKGMVGGLSSSLPAGLGGARDALAVVITTAIFFVLSLIVIIIVGIFLPKFFDKFRESNAFAAVDGVFGAIIFTALIFALMMAFGGIAQTLSDLPAMENLNYYMDISVFADCFYACNPMQSVFASVPLRKLFIKE